jgi:hypothetical protein
MTASATLHPRRRAELACWPGESNGRFLVRSPQTGETFELGEEEYFLLSLFDGRHSAEQVRAAFTARFERASAEQLGPPESDP